MASTLDVTNRNATVIDKDSPIVAPSATGLVQLRQRICMKDTWLLQFEIPAHPILNGILQAPQANTCGSGRRENDRTGRQRGERSKEFGICIAEKEDWGSE